MKINRTVKHVSEPQGLDQGGLHWWHNSLRAESPDPDGVHEAAIIRNLDEIVAKADPSGKDAWVYFLWTEQEEHDRYAVRMVGAAKLAKEARKA